MLDSRVAVAVGTVSYGVFLWHYQWLGQLHTWGAFDWIRSARTVSVLVMTTGLTLVTAALSWILLEKPLLARRTRSGVPTRRVARPRPRHGFVTALLRYRRGRWRGQ